MGRRLLREESGFTFTEMLVTIVVMLLVMSALYSIFDMSIRVFSFGNDKVEATDNARLGLEKIARELRAAYPADLVNGKTNLFWSPGNPATAVVPVQNGSQVTFGNDRNENRRVYNSATGALDSASVANPSGEELTYNLVGTSLRRNGEPVVENVKDADGDGTALTFTYLKADGTPIDASSLESDIRMVRIKLEVSVRRGTGQKPGSQILQTNVSLRNRGE